MRLHIVWTIFKKEITEALRDRVTLLVVVGLPLVLYPLLVIGAGKMKQSHDDSEERRVSRVALWGDVSERLIEWLERTNVFSLSTELALPDVAGFRSNNVANSPDMETESANADVPGDEVSSNSEMQNRLKEQAHDLITSRKVDAVLVARPGFSDALDEQSAGQLVVYYDSIRPASEKALSRLRKELNAFRGELIEQRERERGLPPGFSVALQTTSQDVSPPTRRTRWALSMLLPLVLILLSATGSLYAAIDLTAGEKDRMTMQTLLCAPVRSVEIVAGKFLTIWAISLLAALANAISLSLTVSRVAASIAGLDITAMTVFLVLPCLLPATCTIAALFLAVAVLARDAKDAGNFLGATFTLLMVPMTVTMAPGIELNTATAFVPLVNVALLIKALFAGGATADLVFLALLAAVAYAVLALIFAAHCFSREQVLLGGRGAVRSLFRFHGNEAGVATPSLALVTFIVSLVALFYCSLLIERVGLVPGLLLNFYGALLLPVIVAMLIKRLPPRTTLSLKLPHWRSVVGSILVGATGAVAVAGIVLRILPAPESVMEDLKYFLMLGDPPAPLWLLWIVLALSPAVCEELLFRGLIFSGFRKYGAWVAIVVSALLFGIAHASIYRLLPTFALGLLMGVVIWRSGSIYCSMLVHALNNGLIITVLYYLESKKSQELLEMTMVPWSMTVPAIALTLVGVWMMCLPQKKLARAGV
ncbi:MAG TPA: ABC transporter permease subunit/CPBP intramembrane protease [Verrucomicrobiota bacterium]|nr:ABC transporter permease subunit/CPBP intramembrane protease [Verrucomicrobiota bacterium]